MSTDLCHLLLTQHSHLFPPHLLHVNQTYSPPSPNPFFPTIQLSISIHNPLHEFPIQFLSDHLYSSISPGTGELTSQFPFQLLPFFSLSFCHVFLSCFLPSRLSASSHVLGEAFRDQKALLAFSLRPSLLQSFSVGFSKGQWLQPSDAASAMPINVGGLKMERGERGKKVPAPASPYITILNRLVGCLSPTGSSTADTSGTGSHSQTHSKSDMFA